MRATDGARGLHVVLGGRRRFGELEVRRGARGTSASAPRARRLPAAFACVSSAALGALACSGVTAECARRCRNTRRIDPAGRHNGTAAARKEVRSRSRARARPAIVSREHEALSPETRESFCRTRAGQRSRVLSSELPARVSHCLARGPISLVKPTRDASSLTNATREAAGALVESALGKRCPSRAPNSAVLDGRLCAGDHRDRLHVFQHPAQTVDARRGVRARKRGSGSCGKKVGLPTCGTCTPGEEGNCGRGIGPITASTAEATSSAF